LLKSYLVEKITSGKEPQVIKKGCLNQRKGQQGCSFCVDACPAKAIAWRGKMVIDGSACDGCNICAALCPSQALRSASVSYKELLSKAGGGSLLLTCRESPVRGASITVPCLAGLHWEFIAALGKFAENQKLYFYLANCSTCFRESSLWVLHASLEKARSFLKALNHPVEIQPIFAKDFSLPAVSPDISRRELFSLFKAGAFKTIDKVIDDFIYESKEDVISEQRQCMGKVIHMEDGVCREEGDFPFSNWHVGEACSGCGFCRGICPWGAWTISQKDKFSTLSHSPWKCVSCGLCASLCPQKAIRAEPWRKLPPKDKKIAKKTMPLQRCRRCSSQIPGVNDEGLCGSCAKKELLKKRLK
jgi:energy-converting hydrogenase A subunit P